MIYIGVIVALKEKQNRIDKMGNIKDMSFEDALLELEQIVEKLERGDVPLETSIELYERGAKLKAHCQEKLKSAQLKVDKIIVGENNQISSTPFDEEI